MYKFQILLLNLLLSSCSSVRTGMSLTSVPAAPPTILKGNFGLRCNDADPNMKIALRDLKPGQPELGKIEYRYRLRPSSDSTLPTIVYLPGGPTGYPSMPDANVKFHFGFPLRYPAVMTDIRGDGCNGLWVNTASGPQGYLLHSDFATTRILASDVVSIIRELGLSNYIIYGHSYGTYHATLATALLEEQFKLNQDIKLPKVIVLEGVLAKAFDRGQSTQSVNSEWQETLAFLNDDARAAFSGSILPLNTEGVSAENWGLKIQSMLYQGHAPLVQLLNRVPRMAVPEKSQLAEQLKKLKGGQFGPIFAEIVCRETAEDFFWSLELSNGKIIDKKSPHGHQNLCTAYEDYLASSFNRPLNLKFGADKYDAANWKLKTPIIYFNGDDDAATPMFQARYHFESQMNADRILVKVSKAGHLSLKAELKPCDEAIWTSIVKDGLDMENAVTRCGRDGMEVIRARKK